MLPRIISLHRFLKNTRLWLLGLFILAPATLDSVASSYGQAQPQPIQRKPPESSEPHLPPRPIQAIMEYGLAPRAGSSWVFWDENLDTYREGYANPSTYELRLSGCASSGGIAPVSGLSVPIRHLTWTLQLLDDPPPTPLTLTVEPDECATSIRLTRLGKYRIDLRVISNLGQTATTSTTTTLRDLLVVSIGDSFGSGEGNPDSPKDSSGPAVWSDGQCHRSFHAAPYVAADRMERADTSVTFLSFACSGAEIHNALSAGYVGQDPDENDRKLERQVKVARDVIGDPSLSKTRHVDVLFVSLGANDVGLSTILRECAKPGLAEPGENPIVDVRCSSGDRLGPFVDSRLRLLAPAYDRLDVAISTHMRTASVIISEYPAYLFTNSDMHYGGCGVFGFIDGKEAKWLTEKGLELNGAISKAAKRNGWIYVDGLARQFRGHGYCAGATWFRGFTESHNVQGDELGTAHPNIVGHRETAVLLRRAIPRLLKAPLPVRVTVDFTRIRLDDDFVGDTQLPTIPSIYKHQISFGVVWNGMHRLPVDSDRSLSVSQLNRWIGLQPGEHRFTFFVAGDSFAIQVWSILPGIVIKNEEPVNDPLKDKKVLTTGLRPIGRFVIHRREDNWDADRLQRHRSSTQHGGLEVEYRITVAPVPITPGEPIPDPRPKVRGSL
jgi:hypothetical protein